MKAVVARLGVIALLVLSALATFSTSTPAQDGASLVAPRNVDSDHIRTRPRTDGATVVWIEQRDDDGGRDEDVYGASLADGQPFPIAVGPASQTLPDIDHGVAVWAELDQSCVACSMDIRGKNLLTGQEFVIAASAAEETRPAISARWVIWRSDAGASSSLMARDLGTMAEPISLVQREIRQGPELDGDRIVWEEGQGRNWRLYTLRIGDVEPTLLASGVSNSAGGSYGFAVAGDTVVYVEGPTKLMAANLATGTTTTIPALPYDQAPGTDGRYIVWDRSSVDGPSPSDPGRHDLMGYDLQSDSLFTVEMDNGYNTAPALAGSVLVWQRDFREIHAAPIADVLPSARRHDPVKTDPNWIYVPQTGHYVAHGFKAFWQQSGGLPVFGYPLTEEFAEHGLTVQYFERQRFEYHPEHQGTPYETELGRLGADDAQQRNLLATVPFQPLPPTTSSDTNCTFVRETGHRLCSGFRTYWQSHGLEFGDAGLSYRESLALFGYPISEEFVENGMTVQYFERARFEYHPDKPEPYKVLLGRLGADLLALREWPESGR